VGTNRAGDFTPEFHLSQCALKIRRWHGADQCVAFVASDLSLFFAHEAEQATAALGISEISCGMIGPRARSALTV
jgi:hypothetical protein